MTRIRSLGVLVVLLAAAVPSSAATLNYSITSVYLLHDFGSLGGDPTNYVPLGAVVPVEQNIESYSEYGYNQNAAGLVYGNATADVLHAFAQASASVTGPGTLPPYGTGALAYLSFTVQDELEFQSGTLPPGTPVTFNLTATLHADVSSTVRGTCPYYPNQVGSGPGGAFLEAYQGGPSLFTPLSVDTCGATNLATFSGNFTSAVGSVFGFETIFGVQAGASVSLQQSASNHATVDATDTGEIAIQVLTPGVSFVSASGASYSGVPEPSTIVLVGVVLLAYAIRRLLGSSGRTLARGERPYLR